MKTTTAQVLYDAREERAIISGLELHDLFRAVCGGEPSPAGRTPISVAALRQAATEMAASVPEYSQFVEDALTVTITKDVLMSLTASQFMTLTSDGIAYTLLFAENLSSDHERAYLLESEDGTNDGYASGYQFGEDDMLIVISAMLGGWTLNEAMVE